MTAMDLMVLRFLQASLGCVVAGGAAWMLLALACRRWPALAQTRWVWLLAQAVIVVTFLAVLAPQRTPLSVLSAIELPPIELSPIELHPARQSAASPIEPAVLAAADTAAHADETSTQWLVNGAQAWLVVYLLGAGLAVGRLLLAQRALRRLIHGAERLTDLATHDGFKASPADRATGIAVFETELAVSPMLIGVWSAVLLLPRHLRRLDMLQQQMVIAHEMTHWRRRDPLWMAASIAAQTILWFNPVLRQFGARLTWAQELGCDQQVLAGRAQAQRQAYAAALVSQLKLQRVAFGAALAFGGLSATTLTARLLLIRDGAAAAPGVPGRWAVGAGFAVVFAASVALQPAFAWRLVPSPSLTAPIAMAWRVPLEHARVSSFFGVVSPLRPNGHGGIDFVAKAGTPVLASADGTVVSSSDLDAGGAKYGKAILIVHANGLASFYAHLERRLVAAGDVVKSGQRIGLSGATGRVTGPHLHFEMRRGGQTLDPASVLAGLDTHATPSALRARAALAH